MSLPEIQTSRNPKRENSVSTTVPFSSKSVCRVQLGLTVRRWSPQHWVGPCSVQHGFSGRDRLSWQGQNGGRAVEDGCLHCRRRTSTYCLDLRQQIPCLDRGLNENVSDVLGGTPGKSDVASDAHPVAGFGAQRIGTVGVADAVGVALRARVLGNVCTWADVDRVRFVYVDVDCVLTGNDEARDIGFEGTVLAKVIRDQISIPVHGRIVAGLLKLQVVTTAGDNPRLRKIKRVLVPDGSGTVGDGRLRDAASLPAGVGNLIVALIEDVAPVAVQIHFCPKRSANRILRKERMGIHNESAS